MNFIFNKQNYAVELQKKLNTASGIVKKIVSQKNSSNDIDILFGFIPIDPEDNSTNSIYFSKEVEGRNKEQLQENKNLLFSTCLWFIAPSLYQDGYFILDKNNAVYLSDKSGNKHNCIDELGSYAIGIDETDIKRAVEYQSKLLTKKGISQISFYLPITISFNGDTKFNSDTKLLYTILCVLNEEYINAFKNGINEIVLETKQAFAPLSFFLFENLIYVANYRMRISQSKSAVGSIMSRNGSHNIGSHVLAALTQNVGTLPDDRVLFQYLQQRMDYIATVTTDFPSWGSSTMFVGDMMKTFFSQHHLLEYISGSEGLHAYRFQDPNLGDVERRKQTGKIKLFIRRIHENIRGAEENEGIEIGSRVEWKLLEESAKDHALHFIRYPDKENIHFIDYQKDSFLPLEHDVSLAIPGGVIGEHAFFTILENIIRNAAKHGWAAHTRKSDNAGNLEIYIDFLDNPLNDYIEFTIWDNMSDVLKAYNAANEDTRKKIDRISNNASVHLPLDKKQNKTGLDSLQSACGPKAAENDKIDIKNLPLHWQQQLLLDQQLITEQGELRRENWGLAEMRISAGYLRHCTISQIGRLEDLKPTDRDEDYIILPVAVPGVCVCKENGNGGVRCADGARRAECNVPEADCPISSKLYHLGYRFKVPKPCDMLIVLTLNINIDWAAFKKKGVYFAITKEQNGQNQEQGKTCFLVNNDGNIDENKPIMNFNFNYVVFPDEEVARLCGEALLSQLPSDEGMDTTDCWKSLFPFRLLTSDDDYMSVFDKLQKAADETDEAKQKEDIQAVKNEVYRLWLEKLKSDHTYLKERLKKEHKLTMQLQTESSASSGGRGLITNRDLLEFVFRNNFHSVITNLKPDFKDYPDCLMVLDLLAVYPEPYLEIPRDVFSDIYSAIADILAIMCDKLERFWPSILELEYNRHISGQVNDGKQYSSFVMNYHSRILKDASGYLNRSVAEIRTAVSIFAASGKTFSDDELLALIQDGAVNETNSSPFSALVDATGLPRLSQALNAAYQTADTLLRKYEERIVTLPKGYSMDKLTAATRNNNKLTKLNNALETIGIKITDGKGIESFNRLFGQKPMIKYCRHDNALDVSTFYAEALSGSQSYLNTLHRELYEPDDSAPSLFVNLAENALIRLLIIDERVSDFLKKHLDNKSTFEAMNIDVVDITSEIPDAVKPTEKTIQLKSLQLLFPEKQLRTKNQRTEGEWDMLIIHQGIIDKWFISDHNKKAFVGQLIRNLQTQIKSARVVVTTGRGYPDNIPDWIKILHFSMLESTLFRNYPEKLLLVGALMNMLPTSDKNRS